MGHGPLGSGVTAWSGGPSAAAREKESARLCVSHAPLTLPSAAARRPSPLHAPTRLLIPRCAPTAHGPASNRSMPQKSSRKAIIVSCFRNPRRPPCVACLASPCGRGAVPLQAWPSRGQRSTSPPPQFVFLLHAALRTWLTLILRSLMGTQEGSSFWLPSLVQPASPASINLSRHAKMCWSPEQLLHPSPHSLSLILAGDLRRKMNSTISTMNALYVGLFI